jgi:energy-coupling factor transporter ATP-binding protein EcfA2
MQLQFSLRNYRCFSGTNPATFTIDDEGPTAFVGPNNAGKSTLVRFLYEFRKLFELLRDPAAWGFSINQYRSHAFNGTVEDIEVFNNSNTGPLVVEISSRDDIDSSKECLCSITIEYTRKKPGNFRITKYKTNFERQFGRERDIHILDGRHVDVDGNRVSISELYEKVYGLHDVMYIGPYRNMINIGGSGSYHDIHIGEQFIDKWEKMRFGSRQEIAACGVVKRSIESLLGYRDIEILPSKITKSLQIEIDGKVYRLHELGSGISELILILVNAALSRPGYILIDEPELHLHPSLQSKFMFALESLSRLGVVYSTHSIGLARSTALHTFAVHNRSDGHYVSRMHSYRHLPELLGEMSFSTYREMGFDSILLVEGVHDVKVMQHFLRLLGKEMKYVLIPLGGDAMINSTVAHELSEMQRIAGTVCAIIDSEKKSLNSPLDTNRVDFGQVCANLSISCCVLERRKTENYFPTKAIVEAFGDGEYEELGHFGHLDDAKKKWSKKHNWLIAEKMKWSDIESTDLGRFLASL